MNDFYESDIVFGAPQTTNPGVIITLGFIERVLFILALLLLMCGKPAYSQLGADFPLIEKKNHSWVDSLPQPDTLKIMMLCADTTTKSLFITNGYITLAWWKYLIDPDSDCVIYLDEKKKQLSKNIIVWTSKEIK